MLVCSAALTVAGAVAEVRRRKPGGEEET